MNATTPTPLTDIELDRLDSTFLRKHDDFNIIVNGHRAAAEIRALRAQIAQHAQAMGRVTDENQGLRADRDDLLAALKLDERMMGMLWKAVPWGNTSRLDVALLDNAERTRKAAIARAEGRGEKCQACRGTGADPLSDNLNWLPCKACGGKGGTK